MAITRRDFLQLSFKSGAILTASNFLLSCSLKDSTLPPADKIRLRFAVASDGHFGEKDTSFIKFHDDLVTWLNKEKTGRGLQFSFINGDIFHDDPALLPQVKEKLTGLQMPLYVSHGNHDRAMEKDWEDAFGHGWDYSFAQNDVQFLVLNTADITGKYICPDIEWARAELEKSDASKPLFVFMHITPVKWTDNGIECPELVSMFAAQRNLKMVFHGHDHIEDSQKESGGKHYFFDAHYGGSWGTPYKGYRIVEVYESGDVLTYQMNAEDEEKVNENKLVK